MSRGFFDDAQIAWALGSEALPALERLAQAPSLRDRAVARFDRDGPPRYVTSTEEEDSDEHAVISTLFGHPLREKALDDVRRLLDEPLDDKQCGRLALGLACQTEVYSPGQRYNQEVKHEKSRVESWARVEAKTDSTREYFVQYGGVKETRAGIERVNIIARRNIKRRWQKLGVWNPDWGIPGRANPQPQDDMYEWKWRWQHGDAAAEWQPVPDESAMLANSRHPVTRAIRLRQRPAPKRTRPRASTLPPRRGCFGFPSGVLHYLSPLVPVSAPSRRGAGAIREPTP